MPGQWADDEKCQDFAANLEKMLAGFSWSRADLARRCNYATTAISNIPNFQRAPTVPNGEAFDGAFGLTDMLPRRHGRSAVGRSRRRSRTSRTA